MEACNLSQMYEDDLLIRVLLHDESPIILTPHGITSDSFDNNNLISNTYSGPTITDIETALLATSSNYTNYSHDFSSSLDRISEMERGASRSENKYILKIKSNGNVMADDGYKWRKYGQKTIKNSSNPRSYYKCTNPRCGAKKQVERSNDDPDTLIITYEGLHLHYMYPLFIFGDSDPPTKKFRRFNFDTPAEHDQQTTTEERKQDQPSTMVTDYQPQVATSTISSQGLLEDMVPLLVRNPIIYTSKSSSSSSSSYPSPPASPSFSWSPEFDTYLDSHV